MIALSVRVRRADADQVLARLLELVPAGVEERNSPQAVEYVIYGPPDGLPSAEALRAAAGRALLDFSSVEVADDWSERWKQWHQPVEVTAGGRRLRVRPPWAPVPDEETLDLVVDPGQAFGTGGHHTTRLCLELLLELEPGGSLADWGCGTGVLALAAARLGWDPVTAVDHDPAAVEATRANATRNGLDKVEVGRADLASEPGPAARVVMANLMGPLLRRVAARLDEPPEILVVSGLLHEEADGISAAFAERGLREARRAGAGEWTALVLERQ